MSDLALQSADGTRLALHRWPAQGPAVAQLLIVHGYFEHGARYSEFAETLAGRGIAVSAVDLRGHGRSEGVRGHIVRFDQYLDDVDAAFAALTKDEPRRFVLGQSLGGLVSLVWAAQRAATRGVAGLVLTSPYLERALVVPGWKLALGRLMSNLVPSFSLPSSLDSVVLSHDPTKNDAYRTDPLIFGNATARWFVEVTRVQEEVVPRLTRLAMPLLCVVGDGDRVARPQATLAAYDRLTAPEKSIQILAGQYHEVLNELERSVTYDTIASWIIEHAT